MEALNIVKDQEILNIVTNLVSQHRVDGSKVNFTTLINSILEKYPNSDRGEIHSTILDLMDEVVSIIEASRLIN